jgi:hypothetical protein
MHAVAVDAQDEILELLDQEGDIGDGAPNTSVLGGRFKELPFQAEASLACNLHYVLQAS